MTIDISKLQDQLTQLITNISEQISKSFDVFYNPNPLDVQMQQYDSTGNLQTYTVPNYAKFKQQVWQDVTTALGMFDQTIYVDPQNGDDSNSGTSSDSPLKTVSAAINRIPTGGAGRIVIIGSWTFDPNVEGTDRITIKNKLIRITADSYHFTPILRTVGDRSYRAVTQFELWNSFLELELNPTDQARFEVFQQYPDGWDSAQSHPAACSIIVNHFSVSEVLAYSVSNSTDNKIIIIPQDFTIGAIGEQLNWTATARSPFAVFSIVVRGTADTNIFELDGNLFLMATVYGGSAVVNVGIDSNVTVQDSAGNAVDVKTKILNVIKDSNGVPRNVVSNLIL